MRIVEVALQALKLALALLVVGTERHRSEMLIHCSESEALLLFGGVASIPRAGGTGPGHGLVGGTRKC